MAGPFVDLEAVIVPWQLLRLSRVGIPASLGEYRLKGL